MPFRGDENQTCSADVLLSLALYSSSHETTRPQIVVSEVPFLKIEDGTHPTLMPSFSPGEFIPNDTSLGGDQVGSNLKLML